MNEKGGIKKMNECEECGKKLGILHGYNHPALGKKHTVCSNCFYEVSDSIQKWTDFILPYADFFQKSKEFNFFNFSWKHLSHGLAKFIKV
jgi:ribosomal protein L32